MDSVNKIKVSIIGSTGYVGAELVRGFASHPVFELNHLIGRSFAGGDSGCNAAGSGEMRRRF